MLHLQNATLISKTICCRSPSFNDSDAAYATSNADLGVSGGQHSLQPALGHTPQSATLAVDLGSGPGAPSLLLLSFLPEKNQWQ